MQWRVGWDRETDRVRPRKSGMFLGKIFLNRESASGNAPRWAMPGFS